MEQKSTADPGGESWGFSLPVLLAALLPSTQGQGLRGPICGAWLLALEACKVHSAVKCSSCESLAKQESGLAGAAGNQGLGDSPGVLWTLDRQCAAQ